MTAANPAGRIPTGLAPYYRRYELPWSPAEEMERRFRVILRNLVIAFAIIAVIIPFLPRHESVVNTDSLPERVVQLVLEPPPPPPPPPPPRGEIRLQGVTFATNSAELIPQSATALDTQVRQFQQYPNLVIEVRGYTDNRGSAELNLKLSQRRAEAVMDYLKTHGVSNQITARGYGKADPIADNSTKEGQLANRRVTLNVSGAT